MIDRDQIRATALRIIHLISRQHQLKVKSWHRLTGLLAPPPLSVFQHLEPVSSQWNVHGDGWWIFLPEDCTPDVLWPIDAGMIADHGYDDDPDPDAFSMARYTTITPKQARGIASRVSPHMVVARHGQMDRGELLLATGLFTWLGGQWHDARGGRLEPNDHYQPLLATSIALRQRYEWAVSLGLENLPSVRFATDPTGIKDAFRIRDLPEGRDRREALMTWVTDHWRMDRYDPEMEIYVRQHLRGTTKFTWKGMDCTLLPAIFDIEKRDKLIQLREDMKAKGEHKRVRLMASTTLAAVH
jgi:hypothetical protein